MNAMTRKSQLLPERAFVVQLRKRAKSGRLEGRVEHVTSGRFSEFGSLAELAAFMDALIARSAPGSGVKDDSRAA